MLGVEYNKNSVTVSLNAVGSITPDLRVAAAKWSAKQQMQIIGGVFLLVNSAIILSINSERIKARWSEIKAKISSPRPPAVTN